MSPEARDALVESVAKVIYDHLVQGSNSRELARAALAVIEPAVREDETKRCLAAFAAVGWDAPVTPEALETVVRIRAAIARAGGGGV